ncbi:hypothetical protein CVIRNUC_005250 [Coccomyxa viridis]|uniref:Thioredoxin domain-containing protein n=1 Tax=Coccomyxa viridis TaxID=1274662 RepID=A0AAV1I4Z1_9CHLO|nr:hypothetical protein CVIRNUC_005250 [Coccomyxa viridis]
MSSAHCTSALRSDTRPCWGCQGHRLVKLHVRPTPGWPCKRNCFSLQLVGRRSYTKRYKAQHRAIVPTVMVLTESTPFEIGTKAPAFQLPEPVTGKIRTLEEISEGASATLVMFICNHCPFVKLLKEGMVNLAKDYQSRGLATVAISSNSVKTHPQDGPEEMAADAQAFGYPFPYLYDETQEVAKAYRALCTPEFMVFDSKLELQYHGQFDSARPSKDVSVTGEDLRAALDDILAGKPVQKPIKPSVGCSIKWHP